VRLRVADVDGEEHGYDCKGIPARPGAALAPRLFGDYPGFIPPGRLPPDWLKRRGSV